MDGDDDWKIKIPCGNCDHQSCNAVEAHQHWQQHQLANLQPFLGPFLRKSQLITVVGLDGTRWTDRVTDVVFDKETGEERAVFGDQPDPLSRAMAFNQRMYDNLQHLTLYPAQPEPGLLVRIWRWVTRVTRRVCRRS